MDILSINIPDVPTEVCATDVVTHLRGLGDVDGEKFLHVYEDWEDPRESANADDSPYVVVRLGNRVTYKYTTVDNYPERIFTQMIVEVTAYRDQNSTDAAFQKKMRAVMWWIINALSSNRAPMQDYETVNPGMKFKMMNFRDWVNPQDVSDEEVQPIGKGGKVIAMPDGWITRRLTLDFWAKDKVNVVPDQSP